MGLKCKIRYLCLIFVFSITLAKDFQDTDTITVEADTELKRNGRQILLQGTPHQPLNSYLVPSVRVLGTCVNSKGYFGKCTPFRQCYPDAKVSELNNIENWISGMYDTCGYYTEQGRQMFGVCCTNSKTLIEASVQQNNVETNDEHNETLATPYFAQISNWPPPLPTHPPDHTIPPLPTHPPTLAPGVPTLSPITLPPGQKPVAKPTAKPIHKPADTTVKPVTSKPPLSSASCGSKSAFEDQERIVGGRPAEIGAWPWIAALFNGGRQFCGGSLIDNIHILSAAHCVAHMSSWDVARLTVRLGDHNIGTNSEVRHVEKRVKRIVRHRGFDPRTLYNDIAILTLDSPVQFSQQIRPICLPSGSSDYAGKTATVVGWGSLRESGPQPATLQEVNIPIWSNHQCRLKYGPAAPGGIVESMLCAGEASRDSCSGDSGGPLMVHVGRWTQVGIVSWGIGCGKGQYPGVYTRVEKFMPWITKNLKN